MRLHGLEQSVAQRLEAPLIVVRADADIETTRLNRLESDRLAGFRYEPRRRDWLRGRNALKEVLTALDRGDDTTDVTFPDRQISLTHGGDTAFAVGTSTTCLGLGVDYEPLREIDTRVARWFLNEAEINWLNEQPEGDRVAQLVRLWTVKEAGFKSCPDNAAMTLNELSVSDPAAAIASVVASKTGACIRVTCCACESGYLSIGILRESP